MTDQLPLKPIESDLTEKARNTIAQRPQLEELVAEAVSKGLRNVFFVGAGGSLIAAYPGHYLLEREDTVPVYKLQSDELNTGRTKRLGEGSLVFLASYTGKTKETVAAAQYARSTGATVAIVSKDGGPLAEAANVAFTGQSDLFLQLAAYAVMRQTGVERDWALLDQALEALPEALLSAAQEHEERARIVAETLKDEPITYVLGSGPSFNWAYGLAMCFLQEMQWKHAAGFNSGEFFQGAFEVVNDDVAVINLLGEDPSRPMAERAKRFLDTYASKKTFHIDTKNLTLPGIPAELRGEFSPLAIAVLMDRVARHYEAVRGHDLDKRNYMFKVDY
ncbi:SIS domain-containing protein [Nonomuraea roseoviolacea]|uniref:Fructoselysine-6-phosphate deglycase n=1 Tax=Nonomuraea roseoviolacea subsp. carminata TaxID=160689 RepID=A0ABT1K8C0_9ACTN|nr:SIS domain-containing protein [Nonomuraea roseoviolacea]MCP2350251.1 fructoselysine-6-phosphate deglycase [Nonomuraea roseoviolacea subsp. carminata]